MSFVNQLDVLLMIVQVVGGLVWAITASNVELDVDIVFQENFSIGQRM